MTSELRVGLLAEPHGSGEAHPPYGVHRIPTRLYDYFDDISDRTPDAPALICGDVHLSYRQLESKANQFAHFLRSKYNAAPEKTVGLLLERGLSTYTSLIGVLKSGAGYVPFDPAYPTDRVQFIAEDASLVLIITQESLYQQHQNAGIQWPCPVLVIDRMDPRESQELAGMPAFRPVTLAPESDPLAYIIYTSGTTGKPKGVAVSHWNVVHEIHAVTNLYKMTPQDRCYQGITIAFDFAVEETWIAWASGAVLIAGVDPKKKVGPGLAKFLNDNRITVFGGVPTLVSTLDDDIPTLRCLIVGGEHLPPEMVERWCKPGRQMWNTYGPTETTITSSMIEVHPGKPVTIGFPLPGYTWYVLDDNLKRLPDGEIGEIVIGGVGVTRGYVNRPELTREKFLDDPFIEPSMVKVARPMMYRSGDRGRISPETQEMEIMGRADDQVKLRGYRFELQEIITLLLEDPAVNNATVATLPFGGPPQDLAAYVTLRQGWDSPDQKEQNPVRTEAELRERLADRLRAKLPTFIVPAYIEILAFLPTLPSGKTDRKSLPQPKSERVLAIKKKEGQRVVLPQNQMEETISKVWGKVFSGAELSVEADFFLDMGGHSLFAAQTISSLRKSDPVFADLSVADLYAYPTIRSLAQYVEDQRQAARATPSQTEDLHAYTEDGHELAPMPERKRYSSCRIWFCGIIQFVLLFIWGMAMMAPIAFILLFWRREERDVIWACTLIAIPIFFPIIAKWLLLGKIKAGRHELWSWYYIRFWLIRKILLLSPVGVLAGTPLIGYYMRTFGAKISSKCHIFSAFFGLPDLIEIEEGACVGYQVVIQPFIIEDGWLDIAPIKICKNATVGTGCFLQAGCVVEEGAVLSDQTLVCRYQRIPANENWGGSPARRMPSRDPAIAWMDSFPEPESCCDNCLTNFLGRSMLNITYLATIIFLTALPVTTAIPSVVILYYGNYYYDYNYVYYFLPVAGVAYFFSTILFVILGKKIVLWGLEPGVYPINSFFGLRKWISDKLMEMSLRTNYSLYSTLYTIPFLRAMGAKIGTWSEVSTVQHIEPDLMNLGNGVFIADMASLGAATFHRGRMALAPTVVGDRTFVGNSAVVRCNTTIPGKCLIGVHSVPPVTEIAEGTSYLGSPSMFLPRRQIVEGFPESTTFQPPVHLIIYRLFIEFWRILIPPMLLIGGGFLFYQSSIWLLDFGSETLHLRHTHKTLQYWMVLYLSVVAFLEAIFFVLLVALLKWLIIGKYIKQMVPLWDPWIRHTEFVTGLYEALIVPILNTFGGTPFLAIFMRIYGVKIGSRVYLDTADITEFDLVDIEDDATVCGPTSLQTHLFEDRIMKMSYVRIRKGANVSARCVVLYDSEIGEEARLDSLSLVMKNESIPANTSWRGIPSRRVGQQDRARPITQRLTEVLVGEDSSRRSSVEERTPSKKPAKKGADGYSLLADDA